MANYDYRCQKCERVFQKTIPMKDFDSKILIDCEKEGCDGKAKSLIGAVGTVFKTDGFYTTDYGSDIKKKRRKPQPDDHMRKK